MLEVARILSEQQFAYDIKFIAFGAEDIGLKGSRNYVNNMTEEELQTTVAMINMDMVGIGDTVQVMTAYEDADSFIADLSEVYLKKFCMEYMRYPEDAGDHQPFELAGIPSVFLNYGPDPYYHTDEDSLDKISKDNLYRIGTLVTTIISDTAKTPMANSYNGIKAKTNKYNSINNEFTIE
jgi:aminopeptidase YwaD